ncbi:MAG: mechanosensitive ion channel family protein [Candidatus Andersenbacteria bacterium]
MEEVTILNTWLATVWFNNSLRDYAIALGYFVGLVLIFRIIQEVVVMRIKRVTQHTHTDIDDAFIDIIQTVRPSVYVILAIYLAVRSLDLPPSFTRLVNAALAIVLVYQAVTALQILIDYIVRRKVNRTKEASAQAIMRFMSQLAKIVLWIIGALFILSNLGVNVTSLIAGLGIGGIAIALAAQNILGDLFSSLAIYFDEPFTVGDFIVVGNIRGTVTNIGIKTTRIKSIEGEEIIISNRELTSDRIQNYRRLTERRVALTIGVHHRTPTNTIKKVPQIIEQCVTAIPATRFGRAHLYSFDTAGIAFRVVFYVTAPDVQAYLDARQAVHVKLKETFEGSGIVLAYPSQVPDFEQM